MVTRANGLAVESEGKARAAHLVDDAERTAREPLAQADAEADRIRADMFDKRRAAGGQPAGAGSTLTARVPRIFHRC